MADFGATQDELAKRIARSRPQIANTLRLRKLPPSVQKKVAAQVISAGHARAVLALSTPEEMERLAESIAENGVLVPLTVRASDAERYELVSGHRRKRAAELAGLSSVPCIVRDMGDDEVVIAMVDSNLQREAILPSERAFAYSMRLEATKHQGQRSDHTSAQLAQKSCGRWSRDILA